MGIVSSIRNVVAAPTADAIRAALSDAEAKHASALAAWSEDETSARWKIVEDAEREVKQLRARLARAEKAEAAARAAQAERERAKEIEAYDAKKAEANKNTAFVVAKRNAVVPLAQALARHYVEILEHCDAHARLVRELQDEARRLGLPPPDVDNSEPSTAEQIVRLIQRAVQQQHVTDGTEYTTAQRSGQLIEGTFW